MCGERAVVVFANISFTCEKSCTVDARNECIKLFFQQCSVAVPALNALQLIGKVDCDGQHEAESGNAIEYSDGTVKRKNIDSKIEMKFLEAEMKIGTEIFLCLANVEN